MRLNVAWGSTWGLMQGSQREARYVHTHRERSGWRCGEESSEHADVHTHKHTGACIVAVER